MVNFRSKHAVCSWSHMYFTTLLSDKFILTKFKFAGHPQGGDVQGKLPKEDGKNLWKYKHDHPSCNISLIDPY